MSKIATIKIEALHVGKSVTFNCAQLDVAQEFSPTWASQDAYGKMDPISTFANVKRTATFSFTSLGKQPDSASKLQADIDLLIKMQYPKYSSSGGGQILSAPPIFSISVLNNSIYSLFKGYFTAFGVVPGSTEGVPPLVIGTRFYERKYNVSLTLQVLHSFIPGWIGDGDPGGSAGMTFEGTGTDGTGNSEQVPNQSVDPDGPVENYTYADGAPYQTPISAEDSTPISPEDVVNVANLGGGTNSSTTPEDREAKSPSQKEEAEARE